MRVRMISRMAGPGGSFQPGQVAEFQAAVAQQLLAGGFAELAPPTAGLVELASPTEPVAAPAVEPVAEVQAPAPVAETPAAPPAPPKRGKR